MPMPVETEAIPWHTSAESSMFSLVVCVSMKKSDGGAIFIYRAVVGELRVTISITIAFTCTLKPN